MRWWITVVVAMGCGRLGFGDAPTDGGGDTSDPDGDIPGSRPLHIQITGRGAAAGTFGVCASQCTYTVVGDVTVETYAADTWSLATTAGCAGPTCTVADGVTELELAFTQAPLTANIAFLSSTPVSIVSGIGTLDTHCQTLATAAGLSGSFLAFASTTTTDARDRFVGSRGWVRPDGMPILDRMTDVGGTGLSRAITVDEMKVVHTSSAALVATGSQGDGTVYAGNNCGDWTTTTMQMSGGLGLATSQWLLGSWLAGCVSTSPIYCFGTGRDVAVQVTPHAFPVGRRVFATTGLMPVGTGPSAGDTLCQSEAAAAGLSGSYRALLATTTQTAADHVGSLAGPWRRTDDTLVTLGDLGASFDAAISVDAGGTYHAVEVTAGAVGLHTLASAGSNCNDWTSSSDMILDSSTLMQDPFVGIAFTNSCDNVRVVCAELP